MQKAAVLLILFFSILLAGCAEGGSYSNGLAGDPHYLASEAELLMQATARSYEATEQSRIQQQEQYEQQMAAAAQAATISAGEVQLAATLEAQRIAANSTAEAERTSAAATQAYRATQEAFSMAATRASGDVTETAAMSKLQLQLTQEAITAYEQARAAARNERIKEAQTWLRMVTPYVIVVVALVLVVLLLVRWRKEPQVVERDARGDAPLLVQLLGNGRMRVLDSDRNPGPVIEMGEGVSSPTVVDAAWQERHTRGDQLLDLGRALPDRSAQAVAGLLAPPPADTRPFRVFIGDDQLPPSLPPDDKADLDADWKVISSEIGGES